ncbi:LOW QUALITY PROTEIN: RING finger protein 32 [Leptosomus discolor]
MEHHDFYKGCSSKRDLIAVSAVALQDHIIHSHQLQDLSLADLFKSRTRNTKNAYRPVNKELVRAVVDTGLREKSTDHKHKEDAEKEYVLDPSPPQLTLAQKLGLAEPHSLPLTAEEWVKMKQRSIQHRGSIQPCAICREEFALQPQACLKAFEIFTGKKFCPLCRKEQYQTKVIRDGARLFKMCAIRIQASWRHTVRKWYKDLSKTVPPKDSELRKQFFEKKVPQISNQLLSSYINLDEFFFHNYFIAASPDVFQHLEGKEILSATEWEKIQMQAWQEIFDCPVCIVPLSPTVQSALLLSGNSNQFSGEPVLLSCSLLFHHTCLQAFEEFSLGEHICPLCCSYYQKKILNC